ncbi:MAG: 3-deoxy-D-manno-octulosonate 8-phosphate phosphatase (KDO 8-P phosphatase) [Porticoccus sp.]|jgi:3-deoxy-D-manno-octulosonate 8-phosphate phosphatase (KDO 8-P phosphatase)
MSNTADWRILFDQCPSDTLAKLKQIKLLCLDVDGVLTNGSLLFDAGGETLKTFNTLDGLGIKALQKVGIEVAIISGRESKMVTTRASDLGIKHIIQGRDDKWPALTNLLAELNLSPEQTAHMGDDLPDLPLINRCAIGITVPNAHPVLTEHSQWVTSRSGGNGAVREACELILHARGELSALIESYL